MIHETAEAAWQRIATRDRGHALERIGRKVFLPLSQKQWVELLAAVCKNNIDNPGRVPDITMPAKGAVQDDAEIFASYLLVNVPSGGALEITPTHGGFECKWIP